MPGAALGYQQALRDEDANRLSYRGVASELRETVREVLDRLAPDKDLQGAGVKIEKDQSGYTQKHKVRHILRSWGVGETARKVPEQSIQLIEELTASLTRSVYERGSVSAHVASPRSRFNSSSCTSTVCWRSCLKYTAIATSKAATPARCRTTDGCSPWGP